MNIEFLGLAGILLKMYRFTEPQVLEIRLYFANDNYYEYEI